MKAKYQALYQCNVEIRLMVCFSWVLVCGACIHTYEKTKEMQACFKSISEYCTLEYCTKAVCWVRT